MSSISWLDSSADEQRRVREIVALFSDKGTLDELGIGQIRDAFSDALFPGTSTIQTRARYFLLVPWAFQQATESGPAKTVLARADRNERRLIEGLRRAGAVDGLIGKQAGAKVKNLPSAIYWSGLTRFGILTRPMPPSQVGRSRLRDTEAEELAERDDGDWSATLPPRPVDFPGEVPEGFELSFEEASWLRDRILTSVPDSLLAHLITQNEVPASNVDAPWDDPSTEAAPPKLRALLDQAKQFSLAMEGASLLYNLLVAERYVEAGNTTVGDLREPYAERLESWGAAITQARSELLTWNRTEMWRIATDISPQIGGLTRQFVDDWIDAVINGRATKAATDESLRSMIERREQLKKGNQARLTNARRLATWSGASGSQALVFRWPTVRTLVTDIQKGMGNAGT